MDSEEVDIDTEEPDSSNNAIDHISIFNEDCLIKIFSELSSVDLINVCKISDRFHQIIKQSVVGRRKLDLGQIRKSHSIEKMFELLGENIVKLKTDVIDTQTLEICSSQKFGLNIFLFY